MRPHALCWASAVLAISATAQAHLIRIPTGLPDTVAAPLDLDGGTLSAIDEGQPATTLQNFFGDFVFGIRGDYPSGRARFILDFDHPVTHVTLKAGVLNQGAFTVSLWNGGNLLTTTAADTLFPGGGFLPTLVEITPPQPATRLTIDGADWLDDITFWSADVVWAVPEPSGFTLLCLGVAASLLVSRVARSRRAGTRHRRYRLSQAMPDVVSSITD